MFTIDSYIFAVIMCVVTMICWGSWANTQKLASKDWPSQLFYWDYVLGLLIISLIYAFTLGSNGGLGRGFIEDLNQASSDSLTSAFIGGIIFNFSNIFLVAALEILGMAVAFPVAIGLALALGVLTNYISAPNEYATILLFSGVGFVIVAIIIDALAYNTYINSFNANLVANESFLDSATIRENVISLARNIGYVPRSKTAAVATINIGDINLGATNDNTPKFLTLRSGLVCVGNTQGTTYRFSIPDEITSSRVRDIGGTSFAQFTDPISVYEGTLLQRVYRVDTTKEQRYIIDSPNTVSYTHLRAHETDS